jgi:hypothetical protein
MRRNVPPAAAPSPPALPRRIQSKRSAAADWKKRCKYALAALCLLAGVFYLEARAARVKHSQRSAHRRRPRPLTHKHTTQKTKAPPPRARGVATNAAPAGRDAKWNWRELLDGLQQTRQGDLAALSAMQAASADSFAAQWTSLAAEERGALLARGHALLLKVLQQRGATRAARENRTEALRSRPPSPHNRTL